MATKRQILEALELDELILFTDVFELDLNDDDDKQQAIDALMVMPLDAIEFALNELPRTTLKELCQKLKVGDKGRKKTDIVSRILREQPGAQQQELPAIGTSQKIGTSKKNSATVQSSTEQQSPAPHATPQQTAPAQPQSVTALPAPTAAAPTAAAPTPAAPTPASTTAVQQPKPTPPVVVHSAAPNDNKVMDSTAPTQKAETDSQVQLAPLSTQTLLPSQITRIPPKRKRQVVKLEQKVDEKPEPKRVRTILRSRKEQRNHAGGNSPKLASNWQVKADSPIEPALVPRTNHGVDEVREAKAALERLFKPREEASEPEKAGLDTTTNI